MRFRAVIAFSWVAVATVSVACGGGPSALAVPPSAIHASYTRVATPGLPTLAIAARGGDTAAGVAIAVATDPGESAILAGLVKARLAARVGSEVVVQPGDTGYRLRVRASSPAVFAEIRAALLTKVTEAEAKEASREAGRILLSATAPSPSSRCEGRLSTGGTSIAGAAALEAVRQRNHVASRVAAAAVVQDAQVEAFRAAWQATSAWPEGTVAKQTPLFPTEATTQLPGRELSLRLMLWTPHRERAVTAAELLTSNSTALRARIEADHLRLTEVQVTVLPSGGACLLVRADAADEYATRLTATGLGTGPARFVNELENLAAFAPPANAPRLRGGDVTEAAEELAWWVLARQAPSSAVVLKHIEFVAPEGRDTEAPPPVTASSESPADVQVKVETGHSAFHVLVGSPCGTLSEGSYNAGLAAWATQTAALDAAALGLGSAKPIVRADGVGIYVHEAPLHDESPESLAYRVTSQALRSWYLPDPKFVAQARRELVAHLMAPSSDLLSRLAQLRAPAHPSWVSPFGTTDALLRQPETILGPMDAGPRTGPLRIAVIAANDAQKDAVVRAAALWKRSANAKCEAGGQDSVRPMPPAALPSETVLIGIPGRGDRRLFEVWAKLLSSEAGPLGKALEGSALRRFSVSAMGRDDARLLVFRLDGPIANLPRAEEAVRKVLDQLRENAVPEPALLAALQQVDTAIASRLETLFLHGPSDPITTAMLRAFAAQHFKPEAAIRTP